MAKTEATSKSFILAGVIGCLYAGAMLFILFVWEKREIPVFGIPFSCSRFNSISDLTAAVQLVLLPPLIAVLWCSESFQNKSLRRLLFSKFAALNEFSVEGLGSAKFEHVVSNAQKAGDKVATAQTPNSFEVGKAVATLESDRLLRRSPTKLDPSVYSNLATDDPRMAVRAIRVGLENIFRNILERRASVHYRKGESINHVLDKIEEYNLVKADTLHLARKLFEAIDLADNGGFIVSIEQATALIDLTKKVMHLYVDWVNEKSNVI